MGSFKGMGNFMVEDVCVGVLFLSPLFEGFLIRVHFSFESLAMSPSHTDTFDTV